MERDDLAKFRAEHASVADAIKACKRPDWALRLAYEATDNRKAVIRNVASMVSVLEGGENLALTLVRPWPAAREALDAYCENTDSTTTVVSTARAFVLGTALAVLLAVVLNRTVWSSSHDTSKFRIALLVLVPGLTVVIKLLFAAIVRRQTARFDDDSAFNAAVERVASAARKHPERVPKAMKILRLNLARIVERTEP